MTVTLNGLPWIERCLESLRGLEVIVVDHGSTDGTLKLVRERSPEVQLIEQENVGYDAGLNAGFRASAPRYWLVINSDAWVAEVERLGWIALRNRSVELGPVGARFALAGVDDRPADVTRALAAQTADRPVVLLAHDPRVFPEAARAGVDLQLSGHTHAGQIWPFNLLVRLSVRFVRGLYRDGASQLYVSPGTAFWGPPMRLGTRAEITELIVRAAA